MPILLNYSPPLRDELNREEARQTELRALASFILHVSELQEESLNPEQALAADQEDRLQ